MRLGTREAPGRGGWRQGAQRVKPIPMLDLKAEFPAIEGKVRAAIDAVLDTQWFVGGPQVGEMESKVADLLGGAQVIAVSSGTDAILLSLMASGIGAGDEVITTPFTFFATAGSIHRTGARVVFVDIEPDTFNIDPARIAAAVTERTKAIVAVHLFGQCAEMDPIMEIAGRCGLTVIEDAAQAMGATYRGRFAGTMGLAGCFSFYPTKNLGGFGEGGMVVTNDEAFAVRCRQMRNHGQTGPYHHELIGGNFRMDTMKAAILLAKLGDLERLNARRCANAAQYDQLLAGIDGVQTPVVREYNQPCFHQYSVLCDRRDELRAELAAAEIGSGVYYAVPLHLQPCFSDLRYTEGDLPVSEAVAKRILSLPVHPLLSPADIQRVAHCVREFYAAARRARPAVDAGQV